MHDDDEYDLRTTVRFDDMDLDEGGSSGPDEWLNVLGNSQESQPGWEQHFAVVDPKGHLNVQLKEGGIAPGDQVEVLIRKVLPPSK